MAVREYSGRIVARKITKNKQSTSSPPSSFFSRCHGYMAHFLRKYLVCFYCNKKSNIKFNGIISQWDCETCEATNYLDENGNITDPPTATLDAADAAPQYAFYRGDTSNIQDPNSRFCSKCLKNQHLKISSLAQFHVEVDPDHPNYKESERRLFAFQRDLERRYPQVCEDCAPGAQELRDKSDKVAKSDWLGRMLDKSRENRSKKSPAFSTVNLLCYIASRLWYAGILGQMLTNITAFFAASNFDLARSLEENYMKYLLSIDTINTILSIFTSQTWIWWSLCCSILSFWWNPMFKHMKTGFTRHITGFGDWYAYQTLLVILRILYYFVVGAGAGALANPSSSATMGANAFTLCFTLFLAIGSRRCLVVDMTPLWNSTPDRLRVEAKPKSVGNTEKSGNTGNSMSDILDEIAGTTSKASHQTPTPPPSTSDPTDISNYPSQYGHRQPANSRDTSPRNHYTSSQSLNSRDNYLAPSQMANTSSYSTRQNGRENNYNNRYEIPKQRSYISPPTQLPVSEMTQAELFQYLQTGEIPARLDSDPVDVEPMDWAPTRPEHEFKPRHRALNPALNPQYKAQPFGQFTATFNEPSPFHGHLPPAPITPAQRLRNPPNRAKLTVSSEEKKQNFFNQMTQRESFKQKNADRPEIEIAPPKFFAPEPGNDLGNQLADLLNGFSIANETEGSVRATKKRFPIRQFFQGLILISGLFIAFYVYGQEGKRGGVIG